MTNKRMQLHVITLFGNLFRGFTTKKLVIPGWMENETNIGNDQLEIHMLKPGIQPVRQKQMCHDPGLPEALLRSFVAVSSLA